ncbi:MAG: type II CAAX endopeptidase family protein [Tissierellia bacterium]|nr:type II CAAX endopeptidase family protein [Tissierellia bacterium]
MRELLKDKRIYLWAALLILLAHQGLDYLFYLLLWELPIPYFTALDSLICLIFIAILLPLYLRLRWREEPLKKREMAWMIPISLAASGMSALILWGLELLPMEGLVGSSLQEFETMWDDSLQDPYLFQFLSIVFLGPIFEELLFRGVIFHSLRKYRGPIFATFLSGVLFGLWHLQGVQMSYTIPMGILLAWVYYRSKNILLPMAVHILNNFYSTLPPGPFFDELYEKLDLVAMAVVLPMAVLLYRDIQKYRREMKYQEWSKKSPEHCETYPLYWTNQ